LFWGKTGISPAIGLYNSVGFLFLMSRAEPIWTDVFRLSKRKPECESKDRDGDWCRIKKSGARRTARYYADDGKKVCGRCYDNPNDDPVNWWKMEEYY